MGLGDLVVGLGFLANWIQFRVHCPCNSTPVVMFRQDIGHPILRPVHRHQFCGFFLTGIHTMIYLLFGSHKSCNRHVPLDGDPMERLRLTVGSWTSGICGWGKVWTVHFGSCTTTPARKSLIVYVKCLLWFCCHRFAIQPTQNIQLTVTDGHPTVSYQRNV